jgi:hypothetical protein
MCKSMWSTVVRFFLKSNLLQFLIWAVVRRKNTPKKVGFQKMTKTPSDHILKSLPFANKTSLRLHTTQLHIPWLCCYLIRCFITKITVVPWISVVSNPNYYENFGPQSDHTRITVRPPQPTREPIRTPTRPCTSVGFTLWTPKSTLEGDPTPKWP